MLESVGEEVSGMGVEGRRRSVRESIGGLGRLREGRAMVARTELKVRGRCVRGGAEAEEGLGGGSLVAEGGRGSIHGLDLMERRRVRVGLRGSMRTGGEPAVRSDESSFRTEVLIPLALPLLSDFPTVRHQLHSLEGQSYSTWGRQRIRLEGV